MRTQDPIDPRVWIFPPIRTPRPFTCRRTEEIENATSIQFLLVKDPMH